jgi:maleate isomerase
MDRRRFLGLTGLAATSTWASRPSRVDAIQEPRWQPDGAGSVARIGVLTPDFDPVPESEMSAMAPVGISIHGSRVVRNRTAAAFAEPPHVDAAAERLGDLAPRAIAFAYTSSSYVLGPEADGPTRTRLQDRVGGIPVVLTCPAAVDALRVLGAKRIALIHPPWFSDEVNDKGLSYFAGLGFDVVQCTRMLPARSFTDVRPMEVFEWVRRNTPRPADAVFVGGNGLRAIGAIDALERALSRPVLTANQVVFWAALRAAKAGLEVRNYGQILRTK